MLHFEDFHPGLELPLAPYAVSREAIIAFAAEFDPQPFHLDEAAAASSMLGGLAASGWHSSAMFMRMMYDGWLKDAASMGSSGIEEARWLKPVRPGDRLTGVSLVLEKRTSASRPHLGVVRFEHRVANQNDQLVLTMTNPIAFRLRETAA
ncbi:MaoC family dehydratase [Afifella sp. JA880]|uniref:MaoC family dehydratase n=1 Tax=Afifella sp. JA880 TaxID=2975280 RepID=UPI0021BBB3F7|nr:MaoC family dehydratase [Afifella sp. JA880]MCT8266209.1 MaoC family dehydratase [Afifella sp. JA880]